MMICLLGVTQAWAAVIPTSITLTVNPTGTSVGLPVTVTLTSTTTIPGDFAPNGTTVDFYLGNTLIGSSNITHFGQQTQGQAQITYALTAAQVASPGTLIFKAVFAAQRHGNDNYGASQGTANFTISGPVPVATNTALTVSQSSAFIFALPTVTLTAHVTQPGNVGTALAAGDVPAGASVTFKVDGNSIGTSAVGAGGLATKNYDTSPLGEGTHTFTAEYPGSGSVVIGLTTYSFGASASSGATPNFTVLGDDEPPVTTLTTDPAAPNANNWFNTTVQVTLTATDNSGTVAETDFILDGGSPVVYTGPFDVSGDGAHTITYSSKDNYGNVEESLVPGTWKSATIQIDTTAPSSSDTVVGPAGNNGYYTGDTSVDITGTDATSGVAKIHYSADGAPWTSVDGATASIPFSGDGTHTVDYRAEDNAGNVEADTHTETVNIDGTAPTVDCDDADGSWHSDNVSIACTASDDGSGLADTADASFSLSTSVAEGDVDGDAATDSNVVYDAAGNSATAGPVTGNKIDRQNPTITGSASPAANGNGWNNTDVTVTFDCDDGVGSGIASCEPDPNTVLSGEGANQSVEGTATDNVSHTATATVSGINIDKTKPTISASATKADSSAFVGGSWTNQDVTVHFTCADTGGSGLAGSCPADVAYSATGSYTSAAATVSDNADNVSDPSNQIVVNIDKIKPTVTITNTNADPTSLGSFVMPTYSVSDTGGSGVASSGTGGLTGGTFPGLGTFTFTVTGAKDNAGNVADTASSVPIHITSYGSAFNGLITPAMRSSYKTGSTVPVKFSIMYLGQPVTNAVANLFVDNVLYGPFRYDASAKQYIANWNTDKGKQGDHSLQAKLSDGGQSDVRIVTLVK
jgi:hypothetical protein